MSCNQSCIEELMSKWLKEIVELEKKWCSHTDSNRGPTDYKSVALPAEL